MWLKAVAIGGHLFNHRPGHVAGSIIIYKFCGDEESTHKTKLLQDGVGVFVIVHITIVKGQDDRVGWQQFVVGNGSGKCVKVYGGVAVVSQKLHLFAEIIRRHGEIGAVNIGVFGWDADVMVHEDGDSHRYGAADAILGCGQ